MDQALESYERCVALAPGYAQAHCNMGVLLKMRGQLAAAVACYERALAAAPNFDIVHVGVTHIVLRRGQGNDWCRRW